MCSVQDCPLRLAIFVLHFSSNHFIFFARTSHRLLYYGLCNVHNAHPINTHWTAILKKRNNSKVRPHVNHFKSTTKVRHTGENNRVCMDCKRTNTPRPADGLVFHPSRQTTLDVYKVRKCNELLAVLMPKQHTV